MNFQKPPHDQFIEYTINGKKYLYLNQNTDLYRFAHFQAADAFSQNGVKIKIAPTTLVQFITADFFYPADFKKTRRFHFGKDSTYDPRIPSGYHPVTFQIKLPAVIEETALMGKYSAKEMFELTASNNKKYDSLINIESGYVQVLEFKTGHYGIVEIYFKLKTKPYKNKLGKMVPVQKIEGRLRSRGKFSVS